MALYLDHNATSPLKPEVKALMSQTLDVFGNPSSTHSFGQEARMVIDGARRQVATLFDVRPEQVVFTSGGTEANNMAIRSALATTPHKRIVTSPTEHHAVLHAATAVSNEIGGRVSAVKVDKNGVVDLDNLERMLAEGDVGLVSIMAVNNETGVCQPVAEIAELCKAANVMYHCDAVQAPGKVATSLPKWGASLVSLSFHKLGGPKGVGALIFAAGVQALPLLHGGGQERGRRGGTENTLGIAGAGLAAELARQTLVEMPRLSALRDKVESAIKRLSNDIAVVGESAQRTGNVSCFLLPGITGDTAVMALDMEGVAVSSGSACSSGRVNPSHVLMAQGFSEDDAKCSVRLSWGWNNTEDDVQVCIDAFTKAWQRLKK